VKEHRTMTLLGAVGLWILLWQGIAMLVNLPLLLPSPWQTILAAWQQWQQPMFWHSVLMSLLRIMGGFLLAMLAGVLLAWLCTRSQLAEALLAPIRTVIRSTPVSSFIILVLLWIKIDSVPTFISFLMVLPVVWHGMQEGISTLNPQLQEMARMYDFSRMKALRYVTLPQLLPFFRSTAATGSGIAWKAGIAAEVIARPTLSIGRHLQDTKVYLLTDQLFAWTLTVILLSILLERMLNRLFKVAGKGGKA
jgi:NitT/TauT family transport system permease protein